MRWVTEPGVNVFIQEYLPYLRKTGYRDCQYRRQYVEEYARLTAILDKQDGIAGLEVNISCPNVEKGGLQFGTDPDTAAGVVAAVRQNTSLPVIVKLSPNVTDVVAIARAVVEAGADALSLINTLLGMAIDIETRRPVLANTFGGLSGPAIKPVALRMVYQVAREVEVPIMGVGGIVNWQDALEFILAGAAAVSIGTGIYKPGISEQIIDELENYLVRQGIRDIRQLIGAAHL